MHRDNNIDPSSDDLNNRGIVPIYNLTKGEINVIDRSKSEYSVTRINNRWTFTMFCSLLNIGAIHVQILVIYKTNTDYIITKRKFLVDLFKKISKTTFV